MALSPNLVRTSSDLAGLDGQQIVATGRYCAVPRPVKGIVRKPAPADRAVLELADGTQVYLEPLDSPHSVRSQAEIDRFNGRFVHVQGIAHKLMPSAGEGLIAPCIGDISDISEIEDR